MAIERRGKAKKSNLRGDRVEKQQTGRKHERHETEKGD